VGSAADAARIVPAAADAVDVGSGRMVEGPWRCPPRRSSVMHCGVWFLQQLYMAVEHVLVPAAILESFLGCNSFELLLLLQVLSALHSCTAELRFAKDVSLWREFEFGFCEKKPRVDSSCWPWALLRLPRPYRLDQLV